MPSQSDITKVHTCVISVIEKHWDCQFDRDMIDDYCDALARYQADTLKKAMKTVLAKCKSRPKLAHVIEGCHEAMPHNALNVYTGSDGQKYAWIERQEKHDKMVSEYCKQLFSFSPTHSEAYREGFAQEFERYITAVASVQAQIICGFPNIGWSAFDIFGVGVMITDDMKRQFFRDQKQIAEGGMIDVRIITSRIDAMRKSAQYRKQQEPVPASTIAKPIGAQLGDMSDAIIENEVHQTVSLMDDEVPF